ncbi:hypothetical protein OOT46_17745 [Aquabacterium sp. A7-Y]|uniref:hypothetical protein n=1 Tax=Aquabacterium sp. A7-Y TaxID=1349605 RepID=UPI00223E8B01|nr:hypothetical protein [Aquabacterium sp. A7-Y]MCW7539684.1 hypothetical protein [Aquabacterium sp. A7-Y]
MPLPTLLRRLMALAVAIAAVLPSFAAEVPAEQTAPWTPLPECAGFPLGASYDFQGLSGTYAARNMREPGQAIQLSLLVTRADQVPRVDGQFIGSFATAAGPVWRAGTFSGLPSNPASGDGFLLFFTGSDTPQYTYGVAGVIKQPASGLIMAMCLYPLTGPWPPSGRPFPVWRVL